MSVQKIKERMEIRENWHGPDKLWTLSCVSNDDGFQAVSVIVMGKEECIVWDMQWTLSNAHRVVAEIYEHGRKPKALFISHGHPDHYFGTQVFLEAFPGTPVYAYEEDIHVIEEQFLPKLEHWQDEIGIFNCPAKPIKVTPYKKGDIDLDGFEIEVIPHIWGDLKYNTIMWIPSIKTVACSDVVFNMAHPFTCEISDAGRLHWIEDLEKIRAMGADVIIPGHTAFGLGFDERALDFTIDYLKKTIAALDENRKLLKDGVPGELAAKSFYYDLDNYVFQAILKRSNEMNANVYLAGREWNDQWNENMGGDDE
ncbi:MAG: MBL fold metallo-hydrolase [Clostridiales Family XIII bacterium]|jgi:glyoxylase-like metal-dependent hydrolase (beta-lactamase superfamily II)|nr:MBL fold metallo-hydrolase [Clostridiales Family XIII bacterium]